jgi:hypothetical protein
MRVDDETYNSNRQVASGNPYKKLFNGLLVQRQLELCGTAAKANDSGNGNLLPDSQRSRQPLG